VAKCCCQWARTISIPNGALPIRTESRKLMLELLHCIDKVFYLYCVCVGWFVQEQCNIGGITKSHLFVLEAWHIIV
jgi:hypothetical protein